MYRSHVVVIGMTRGPNRAVKRADVLDAMSPGVVYTAGSLTDKFNASKDTVYHRLRELAEINEINTKQTGGRARIWWVPTQQQVDDSFIDNMSFRSAKDPKILRELVKFAQRGEPTTTGELHDRISEPQDSIYARLKRLNNRGLVESKKVGANSVVWWLSTARTKVEA